MQFPDFQSGIKANSVANNGRHFQTNYSKNWGFFTPTDSRDLKVTTYLAKMYS